MAKPVKRVRGKSSPEAETEEVPKRRSALRNGKKELEEKLQAAAAKEAAKSKKAKMDEKAKAKKADLEKKKGRSGKEKEDDRGRSRTKKEKEHKTKDPPPIFMASLRKGIRARKRWNNTWYSIKLELGCSRMNHTCFAAHISNITNVRAVSKLPSCTDLALVFPMGFARDLPVECRDLQWAWIEKHRPLLHIYG